MRITILPQPNPSGNSIPLQRPRRHARNLLATFAASTALLGAFLLGGPTLPAQIPAVSPAAPASSPAHKRVPLRKTHHATAAHPPAPQAQAQTALIAPAPPAPKLPDWPANDPPSEASVTWDSHGLHIVASNSSLQKILKEVATDTGATIDGLTKDERIYGAYGPGQARDVLSQLLEGSGYNVVIFGDQKTGEPLQIVLTPRNSTSPSPTPNAAPKPPANNDDMDSQESQQPDSEPEPQQPPEPQPPVQAPAPGTVPPGMPPRTPQQIQQQYLQQNQQN
jgi:hypothetical protein